MRDGISPSTSQFNRLEDLYVQAGSVLPFGASVTSDGINFSIYSRHATACTLVLFWQGERKPFLEIPIPERFRIGDVYAITVRGLDYNQIEYGYRIDGPFEPEA